jgi:hypothetical protein
MGTTMLRPEWTNRCGFFLFAVVGALVAPVPAAHGAELTVEAPASCVDPEALAEEVGDLVGKPLASVAEVDFRIRIAEAPGGKWRLHLETLQQRTASNSAAVSRGSREIEGATCAELAEAASVAIAVSIRSIGDSATAPEPSRPAAAARDAPAPAPAPLAPPPAISAVARPPAPWQPTIALALVTEIGALPDAGLGVEIEGDLQRRSLRLGLLAAWFGSQDKVDAAGAGGTFELALGAALGCFAPRWGRWTGLACGGLELGRLAGTGLGVARPETGASFWRAARADLGLTAAIGRNTAFLLRAGAALPLARPEFVFDGTSLVYRPSRLGGRLTAGVELGF